MNAPIPPTILYADSAYRSTAIPAQPPHKWPQDVNRGGPTRTQLRWGHYANLEPWQNIDAQLQPGMRDYLDGRSEGDLYMNQKRWSFDNSNKWILLIPILKWASIIMIPWILWGFVITGAYGAFFDNLESTISIDDEVLISTALAFFSVMMMGFSLWYVGADRLRYKNYFIQTGTGLSIALIASILTFQTSPYGSDLFWMCFGMAFSVFMGLVGWDYLLGLYLRIFKHDGSGFNRQTGMLTIGRRFQKSFNAPFYEFDATLEFRPGAHGDSGFAIWLHHRYTTVEVFLGGKIQALGMSLEEALAFWDTLQRYMDVSQPLPELPILEQFRHLDPTTVAYDQEHKRNPRRWRDLSYRAWERRGRAEMMKRNSDYNWQVQPCILQAKIDPSLSIEAYYRCQEAKGIQATPKSNDYDNVHRG